MRELKKLAVGPVSSLLKQLTDLGAQITVSPKNVFIKPPKGSSIDLLSHSSTAVKRVLARMARTKLLKRNAALQSSDTLRRKDMIGISVYTDSVISTSILRTKKSRIDGLGLSRVRQLAISVIAGSCRTADRLCEAKMIDPNTCSCGERET